VYNLARFDPNAALRASNTPPSGSAFGGYQNSAKQHGWGRPRTGEPQNNDLFGMRAIGSGAYRKRKSSRLSHCGSASLVKKGSRYCLHVISVSASESPCNDRPIVRGLPA